MFKILLALAPSYLSARHKSSAKAIAGLFAMVMLSFIAAALFLTALLIWMLQSFGAVIACLALGGVCLALGVIIYMLTHRSKLAKKTQAKVTNAVAQDDPIVSKLPDIIKHDARVQEILAQISTNPLAAGTAAVTLGYVLSGEVSQRIKS